MREKIRTKSKDGEFLTLSEAICCFLISLGVLWMLNQIFPFVSSGIGLCLQCALNTGIFFLLDRYSRARRIALLTGAVLLALILATAGGSVWQYIRWWAASFPSNPRFSTSFYIFLTQTLFRLAVCLIVYGLVRCTHGAAVMAALTGVLLVFLKICGYHQNFAGWLILLIGILALFARGGYWRYVDRKTGGGFLTPRRRIGQAALGVGCAAVLLAWMVLPGTMRAGSNNSLWDTIFQYGGTAQGESEYYTYSMTSMGLQEKYGKLGGNITLSDSRPILSVQGRALFSLRGKVYDVYDGTSWRHRTQSTTLFRASSPGKKQRTAFDLLTYPGAGEQKLTTPLELSVKILSAGDCLFSNGALQSLEFSGEQLLDIPVYFTEQAEIMSKQAVPAPYDYEVEALVFDRSREGFDESLLELETDIRQNPAWQDERYNALMGTDAALPYTDLPEEITDITQTLFDDEDSPYTKLIKLESYFRSSGEYTYTLTPGEVPDGEDFVTYFLRTKRGYCVYFATAMAILARSENIPSRLVTGYCIRADKIDKKGVALVSANDAHAWVECYLKGIGWVAFDPTPGSQQASAPTQAAEGPEYHPPEAAGATPTSSAPTESVPSEFSPTEDGVAGTAPASVSWISAFVWMIPAAVLLLLALLFLQWYRSQTLYRLAYMKRKWKDAGTIADRYYGDMLRQLRLLNIVPRTEETLAQFACRADEYLGEKGEDCYTMEACGRILMDWRYGGQVPREEDLQQLERFHTYLENYLKKEKNALTYFVCRIVGIRS